nr:hypothetical protein [Actinomadura chibensis]
MTVRIIAASTERVTSRTETTLKAGYRMGDGHGPSVGRGTVTHLAKLPIGHSRQFTNDRVDIAVHLLRWLRHRPNAWRSLGDERLNGIGQRVAVKELSRQVGTDALQRTGVAVGPDSTRGRRDLVVDGMGVLGRQVAQTQISGSGRTLPQFEPPLPNRLATPFLDTLRSQPLGEPFDTATQLPAGLLGRLLQRRRLDTTDDLIRKILRTIGDGASPGQVDVSGFQSGQGLRERPGETFGEMHQNSGGITSDGQRSGNFFGDRFMCRQPPVPLRRVVLTTTTGKLSNGSQFSGLRQRGLPPSSDRNLEKLRIGQPTQPTRLTNKANSHPSSNVISNYKRREE